jgi:hypothetical protein
VRPDGALYIADWYDPASAAQYGRPRTGQNHGPHLRVARPDLAKAARARFLDAEAAAKALTSPNRATQYLAWTALHALGAKASRLCSRFSNPKTRACAPARSASSRI